MNRIILQLFAVGVCFAIGQALTCYKCDIGFWNLCLTTETTCASGEQCYSGVGKAANLVNIKRKGCLNVTKCNQTSTVTFPVSSNTNIYNINNTCCITDLCNDALSLPGTSGLSLAFAAITALFVINVLA